MKEKLKSLGINIKNEVLLETALTHSSYSNEKGGENYERLEFLGDAVLELISSEYLFLNTKDNEGNMSKIRASYVCEEALATYAEDIDLKKYILVGHGQEKDVNDTIVADVFESVLAVIYLEQGLEVAKNYTLNLIKPYIEKKVRFNYDYKSLLQEMVQTDKKSLEYLVTKEEGPAHNRTFTIEVQINGMIYGRGVGHSKKEAEQKAAKDAYQKSCKK
ncbi:MAG: ribonuclease III [Bacilli bacterium]|nr:ribonuclease III [Bacilli bacterium]